jgi:hypothetical protein
MVKETKFFRKQAKKAERMARAMFDAEAAESLSNLAEAYRKQADVLKAKRKSSKTRRWAGARASAAGDAPVPRGWQSDLRKRRDRRRARSNSAGVFLTSPRPDDTHFGRRRFGTVISFTCAGRELGYPVLQRSSSPWRCEMVVIQDFVERESIALEDSKARDLFSIAVFSGFGLLVSLSVLLLDQYVPGDWF